MDRIKLLQWMDRNNKPFAYDITSLLTARALRSHGKATFQVTTEDAQRLIGARLGDRHVVMLIVIDKDDVEAARQEEAKRESAAAAGG